MGFKRGIIIVVFTVVMLGIGGFIISRSHTAHNSMKHDFIFKSSSGEEHAAHQNTDSSGNAVIDETGISNTEPAQVSEGSANGKYAPIEDFSNIEIVQYTVKAKDTLWGLSRTYMPSYNPYGNGNKDGVITYIVNKNNLKKGSDGRYVIYIGQKITIPKQKNVVLNTGVKKSTTAAGSVAASADKTATPLDKQTSQPIYNGHTGH